MSALGRLRERLARPFVDPNPIALRELRSLMRTPVFVGAASLGALLVGLGVITVASFLGTDGRSSATTGDVTFQMFLGLASALVVLLGPTIGASAFSSEREGHTLEPLLLSGVSSRRLVLGKFLGAYVANAHALVGCLPIVGLAFFYGGFSPVEVLVGLVYVLAMLAPLVAFGVAISSMVPSTRIAIGASMALVVPSGMIGVLCLTGISESLTSTSYAGARHGPFGWIGVLVSNPLDPEVVLALFVAPMLTLAVITWFFLAVAELMTAPSGVVRIRPLQAFMAFAVPVTWVVQAILSFVLNPSDRSWVGLYMAFLLVPALFLAMVSFASESTLAPTSFVPATRGPRRWVDRFFPPDAIGSTRFALVLGLVGILGAAVVQELAFNQPPGLFLTGYQANQARARIVFLLGVGSSYVLAALLTHLIAHVRQRSTERSSTGVGTQLLVVVIAFAVAALVSLVAAIPTLELDGSRVAPSRWPIALTPFGGYYFAGAVFDHRREWQGALGFATIWLAIYGSAVVVLRVRLLRAVRIRVAERAARRKAIEERAAAREAERERR